MLGQKLVLSFSSKIFVKVLQFIGTIIVARIVGPNILGTVAYGVAFVSVFSFLADLGTGTAHMKLISDESKNTANCNKTFSLIRIALIFLFSIVIIVYYLIQSYFFGFTFPTEQHKWVVLISFVTLILWNIINIPIGLFSSRVEQAKQDIPNIIKTIINQGLRIGFVFMGFGAIAISLSSFVATLIVLPIYFYLTKNILFGNFEKILAKEYLKISLPLIVVVAINSYISFGDKLILQHFTDSVQVGIYVVGFRLADFVLLIAGSVGVLFFPTFSKLIIENNIVRINEIINKFERFSFSFVLPFILSLFFFGDFIVNKLFGVAYQQSSIILAVVTVSLFIFTITTPYGNIITAKNRFVLFANTNIIKGVAFTLSSIYFVSYLGLKGFGMSLAILFTYCIYAFSLIICSRVLQKEIFVFKSWPIFVFAIVYSFIFFLLYKIINIHYTSFLNIILMVFYFTGYWSFGYFSSVIDKNDIFMVSKILSVSKISNYVKQEFSNKDSNYD